jgi:hypothetical protein
MFAEHKGLEVKNTSNLNFHALLTEGVAHVQFHREGLG